MNVPFLQLAVGILIGLGAGYLGSFMVLRRMSLVGDALSHVALPGIAVALLFNINPFMGAFAALAVAIIGVWYLERRTSLPSETLVGIFFTVSLALGLLLTPEPELLEALFGNIAKIGYLDLAITAVFVFAVILIMRRIAGWLVLSTISSDLTRSMGVPLRQISFLFLFLVAIVVALGLKVAGTLLMGSLVIIPAAAAKNISLNLSQYTKFAAAFGALSSLAGILLASSLHLQPGPIVVLVSGVLFLGTLLFKRSG